MFVINQYRTIQNVLQDPLFPWTLIGTSCKALLTMFLMIFVNFRVFCPGVYMMRLPCVNFFLSFLAIINPTYHSLAVFILMVAFDTWELHFVLFDNCIAIIIRLLRERFTMPNALDTVLQGALISALFFH